MNDKQYHDTEREKALKHFNDNEKTTRPERRNAWDHLNNDMTIETLQERTEWLLMGSYGYGEQQLALEVVEHAKKANKSYNRNARLFQYIANFEWLAPSDITRKFWKSSTIEKQKEIQQAINQAVEWYEKEYLKTGN